MEKIKQPTKKEEEKKKISYLIALEWIWPTDGSYEK